MLPLAGHPLVKRGVGCLLSFPTAATGPSVCAVCFPLIPVSLLLLLLLVAAGGARSCGHCTAENEFADLSAVPSTQSILGAGFASLGRPGALVA